MNKLERMDYFDLSGDNIISCLPDVYNDYSPLHDANYNNFPLIGYGFGSTFEYQWHYAEHLFSNRSDTQ